MRECGNAYPKRSGTGMATNDTANTKGFAKTAKRYDSVS
jgi:hypothetical protein